MNRFVKELDGLLQNQNQPNGSGAGFIKDSEEKQRSLQKGEQCKAQSKARQPSQRTNNVEGPKPNAYSDVLNHGKKKWQK
ncbi:hypothetical protein Fmac_007046 [Flemingia macrophylla]|uniref:Uncharacterized protein n=1 Tax=Flemingia macrophylla TaxID=520843 RepID=A0ABD1NCC7_9FABA